MNHLTRQLLCLTALVNAAHHLDAANTVTNIVPRSQSFDAARQMVGWNNYDWGINRQSPDDRYYLSFNLTFAYTRTFRDNRLGHALFGDDLTCGACDDTVINISGLGVSERGAQDWLADYFGLPMSYQSTVSFKPTISNFLLDFSFYAGLDQWIDGLYFRIHSPFVHTNWNLNAEETIIQPILNDFTKELDYEGIAYPAGYFSGVAVPEGNTTASFLAYANGCTPDINYNGYNCQLSPFDRGFRGPLNSECVALGETTWYPLCCSRINNDDCGSKGLSRNGFGEIRFVLGRNFFPTQYREPIDCHVGLGVYVAAPTGTRVGTSNYLFEPIVGNGKHWELGGQVNAHDIWWRSEDETKSFGLYLEANVTHLFGANQTRCFDLCSAGSNSRYMLAQRLASFNPLVPFGPTNPATLHLDSSVDSASLQFANEFAPVANLTRRDITSTIAVQGDFAMTFTLEYNDFQWDVGYNFWGRSCEQLRISTDCCPIIPDTWALKGTAFVYGFDNDNISPVALAATDSGATIHGGSNTLASFESAPITTINRFVDNSVLAIDNDSQPLYINSNNDDQQIYTSNYPIIIDEADFNLTGTRGISNKFFTNITYACPEYRDSIWTPYANIGAEVEFGSGNRNNCCETKCDSCCPAYEYPADNLTCSSIKECCSNCALTQWGVWFKVGASYN